MVFQIYKQILSFLPFKGDFQLFDSVLKVKWAISGTRMEIKKL